MLDAELLDAEVFGRLRVKRLEKSGFSFPRSVNEFECPKTDYFLFHDPAWLSLLHPFFLSINGARVCVYATIL